jgi:MSHA biogenesis protein MshN
MSLINRMLQDLDRRQAIGSDRAGLPEQVVALGEPAGRKIRGRWLRGAFLLLIVLAGTAYGTWRAGFWPDGLLEMLALLPAPAHQAPANPPLAVPAPPPLPTPAMPADAVATAGNGMHAASPGEAAAPATPSLPVSLEGVAASLTLLPAPELSPPEGASLPATAGRGGAGPRPVAAGTLRVTPPATSAAVPAGASPARIDKTPRPATPAERAEWRYRNALDLVGRGRPEEAQVELRQALQDDPAQLAARQLWVRLLLDAGQRSDAMAVLDEGLRLDPRQTAWAMLLARLQLEQGDARRAWATLEPGLPHAGQDAAYLGFAAALCRQLGQAQSAADYYRRALALQPQEGRWWVGLGLALEESGHVPEAQEAFRRASRNPQLPADLKAFVDGKLREH